MTYNKLMKIDFIEVQLGRLSPLNGVALSFAFYFYFIIEVKLVCMGCSRVYLLLPRLLL